MSFLYTFSRSNEFFTRSELYDQLSSITLENKINGSDLVIRWFDQWPKLHLIDQQPRIYPRFMVRGFAISKSSI
jgi:hypothetical protein